MLLAAITPLDVELNEQGVHMAVVEMRDRLRELALWYGLMRTLDHDHVHPSMEAAMDAIAGTPGPEGIGDR